MAQYLGCSDQHWGCISYSQHGEDMLLLNIFKQLGIENPTYLDIGAHHPTHISNTKLMYDRGSRGINVEANVNLIAQFMTERSEDINICSGVSPWPQQEKFQFYMFDGYSGRNTFSKEEADKYSAESGRQISDIKFIKVLTINQIVNEHWKGGFPAFLNCDVEGWDYHILKEANFSESAPLVVCVETRVKDEERMLNMMHLQGYQCVIRMGENLIFKRR